MLVVSSVLLLLLGSYDHVTVTHAFAIRAPAVMCQGVSRAASSTARNMSAEALTCPKGSKNCIVTTWTPPAKVSSPQMSSNLVKILETYPQEGQADVDKGGWEIVDKSNDKVRVEYTSGGNIAKLFNGGKPYIDDLVAAIDKKSRTVTIRSSSRVGASDLGVNKKRLQFLAAQARSQGWEVPEPKY